MPRLSLLLFSALLLPACAGGISGDPAGASGRGGGTAAAGASGVTGTGGGPAGGGIGGSPAAGGAGGSFSVAGSGGRGAAAVAAWPVRAAYQRRGAPARAAPAPAALLAPETADEAAAQADSRGLQAAPAIRAPKATATSPSAPTHACRPT